MKRFEKKLDEYYTNKYIEYLEDYIFIFWDLDFKVEKEDFKIKVFLKNRKYKNEHYEELISFKKSRALYCICNFWNIRKDIMETIKEYSKRNSE